MDTRLPYHLSQEQPPCELPGQQSCQRSPTVPSASAACFPCAALLGQLSVRAPRDLFPCCWGAGGTGARRPQQFPTQMPSLEMPSALACTQVLPGACLGTFLHGKGYTGHFSYDLTPASTVSHWKPGPAGAEPELTNQWEDHQGLWDQLELWCSRAGSLLVGDSVSSPLPCEGKRRARVSPEGKTRRAAAAALPIQLQQ